MNLSKVRTRPGYDVPDPSRRFKSRHRSRWTLSVHTWEMEIKHCKRCDRDWCFRGKGRPLRWQVQESVLGQATQGSRDFPKEHHL